MNSSSTKQVGKTSSKSSNQINSGPVNVQRDFKIALKQALGKTAVMHSIYR